MQTSHVPSRESQTGRFLSATVSRLPCAPGDCKLETINAQILPEPLYPPLFPFTLRLLLLKTPKIAMAIPEDVTPQSPVEEQPIIGLIGMGAMGTMYAKHLADAGWKKCALF